MCNNLICLVFTAHYVGITEVSIHLNTVQGLYFSPEVWDSFLGSTMHRVSSFLVFFVYTLRGWRFKKQNRKEEEEGETEQQTYQFTQSYIILKYTT